ncbi:uncharacterized protein LOC125369329 [Ricinus communis]|uniref:uncharacterized protein LOC125369329 n=1 Tax=Ricinus communis TaxID=3988 RepID=UPI00201ABDAD|nr:uncharacterized protein LOC125369329 [Ricinus communis]
MKFVSSTDNRFQQTDSALRNQQASIQNLETQIGQISRMLVERQPGTLPSTTESNPREHVNIIMLQSDSSREVEATKAKEEANEISLRKYQPKIMYPARLKQAQVEQQFGEFLDIFKQLHVNLPFVKVISEMSGYAKFLKEILSNKRKFEDLACVTLNEECSTIFQNNLPEKRHYTGSFTIPYVIGNLFVNDALADLGASINVMPYNLFVKLGLGETKPTRMSIQLTDRYVKYPRGIIENVLIKVNKFIFPVDFVILDMDDESSVPLILGRPFLATSRAMIDVCDGKLKLRVGDETVTFDLHNSISQSLDHNNIMYMELLVEDPLQVTLPRGDKHELICVQKLRPSLEEPLVLNLKELPQRLDYAHVDEDNGLHVTPVADLTLEVREMTLPS